MTDTFPMTKDGLEKLKIELDILKNNERPSIIKAIAEAREHGDLSENAEYDAAKEAQGMLEARISKLKNKLANARLIDDSAIDNSKVFILSTVKIKNIKNKMELSYTLVAENEANIKSAKISVDSPIGKGLLGKEVGEIADIITPAGVMQFEIISITR